VVAEIATAADVSWFAPFLPQYMLLADPGTRDAMMHALQACVPDATLLPQGVARLYLSTPSDQDNRLRDPGCQERSRSGDTYVYDGRRAGPGGSAGGALGAAAAAGGPQASRRRPVGAGHARPYLERACERVLDGRRAVVVEPDPDGPDIGTDGTAAAQTKLAVSRALNESVHLRYRRTASPRPTPRRSRLSHGAGVTLAVAGTGVLGCDVAARGTP